MMGILRGYENQQGLAGKRNGREKMCKKCHKTIMRNLSLINDTHYHHKYKFAVAATRWLRANHGKSTVMGVATTPEDERGGGTRASGSPCGRGRPRTMVLSRQPGAD
jgi:hypothetical protein